ncbi:hypothetical protein AK812_SmicGene11606 [Symbiodinium microadriaticum]|uniref:VWFA domain-containing protein n=1 Tax=Symbiodinium microadriaticum TaxID=2951 RepID=A0A1Q9ECS8_SYMMI|nr:hypothetical protein AK812_SmicGene11606 [Symbiodinium microadriaticum]
MVLQASAPYKAWPYKGGLDTPTETGPWVRRSAIEALSRLSTEAMAFELRVGGGGVGEGTRLGKPILVSVRPAEGKQRTPSDISCVIDVSWSMSMEASVKAASGAVESNGLSMLDIAKHAVRTVIQTLDSQVLPLLPMDEEGRARAEQVLEKMTFGSGTALWQGLNASFRELHSKQREGSFCHTMLLTDGETEDSAQIMQHLEDAKAGYGGEIPGTVSTFGFGYEIDSKLLVKVASFCDGTYAFIPDAGFVGTIFVNSISNLLATSGMSAKLQVKPLAAVQRVLGGFELAMGEIRLGALQYGQSADLLLQTDPEAEPLEIQLQVKEVAVQFCRCSFVDCLTRLAPAVEENIDSGKTMLKALADQPESSANEVVECRRAGGLTNRLYLAVHGYSTAVGGQTATDKGNTQEKYGKAVEKPEYWNRWGKHYVPSVMFAHKLQQPTGGT